VGSRESKLAMIQTKLVINQLKESGITQPIKIEKIATKGDKILNVALDKVGGTNIFINDLETLLKDKKIDFAVHSMKDLNRSEEHTSELQSRFDLVCRLLLEKKKINIPNNHVTT